MPTDNPAMEGGIQRTIESRSAGTSYEALYDALRDLTNAVEAHYAATGHRVIHTGKAREALFAFARRETLPMPAADAARPTSTEQVPK